MSEKQKKNLIGKVFVINPNTKTLTSTNGKLTIACLPSGVGQKKHQQKRKRTAKTFTSTKKSKTN
jgi:hypothetical protein